MMEDRIACTINRRALRPRTAKTPEAAEAETAIRLVIRQLREIGESLQLPGRDAALNLPCQIEIKPGDGIAIRLAGEQRQRLLQELQRADTVTCDRANVIAAASGTAAKLAADHLPEMLVACQAVGCRLQQPPVLGVRRDHRFAKRVDFVFVRQTLESLHAALEVVADEFGIVIAIEGQLAIKLPRVPIVAGLEGGVGLFPRVGRRRIGGEEASDAGEAQNRGEKNHAAA